MTFPSDDILIARGKYSTLSRERRVQLERARKVCDTMMQQIHHALKAMNQDGFELHRIAEIQRCLDSLLDAGQRIVKLCEQLNELRPEAWDEEVQ
jgi:hypothetical protein